MTYCPLYVLFKVTHTHTHHWTWAGMLFWRNKLNFFNIWLNGLLSSQHPFPLHVKMEQPTPYHVWLKFILMKTEKNPMIFNVKKNPKAEDCVLNLRLVYIHVYCPSPSLLVTWPISLTPWKHWFIPYSLWELTVFHYLKDSRKSKIGYFVVNQTEGSHDLMYRQ